MKYIYMVNIRLYLLQTNILSGTSCSKFQTKTWGQDLELILINNFLKTTHQKLFIYLFVCQKH
jgi:hypothetical protein